jgi:hypothetical protein
MISGPASNLTEAGPVDPAAARVGADPAIVGEARVLEFHRYWLARRGERRFPARADIEPTDIPHLLVGIMLLDVHYEPLDFEYRLIGDDIARRMGSLKGKRVRAAALRNPASTAYDNYCRMIASGVPQFLKGSGIAAYRPGRQVTVSRVHCPLSTDGTVIDKIISYVAFLESRGTVRGAAPARS